MKRPQRKPITSQHLVPLRDPSGRLWGMYDPRSQVVEFRHGQKVERFDLSQYQRSTEERSNR